MENKAYLRILADRLGRNATLELGSFFGAKFGDKALMGNDLLTGWAKRNVRIKGLKCGAMGIFELCMPVAGVFCVKDRAPFIQSF